MRKIFIPLVAGVLTLSLASCSDDTKENHDGAEGKGGVFIKVPVNISEQVSLYSK